MPVRSIRIAIVQQRERAFAELEPRELGDVAGALEQRAGPLEPAAGDGVLAAEGPRVPGEPDGGAGGGGTVAAVAVQSVRALARVKDDVGEIEPPAGKPEPLESFRTLARGQRPLERGARVAPRAPGERLVAKPAIRGSRFGHETPS